MLEYWPFFYLMSFAEMDTTTTATTTITYGSYDVNCTRLKFLVDATTTTTANKKHNSTRSNSNADKKRETVRFFFV